MKRILIAFIAITQMISAFPGYATSMVTHKVVSGDSMWKIAVKYEVGLSEIKSANPHIANPDLIYPGQILNIPKTDSTVTSYENEVIRLVNEVRAKNGLKALATNWELSRVAICQSARKLNTKITST